MTVELYDTHAHLDFPDFQGEETAIVERALAAGVRRIVSIGTSVESSQRAVELADRFGPVYAAVGVHPKYVDDSASDVRADLRRLAQHPKVVAIGEIGLDFYKRPNTSERPPDEAATNRVRQLEMFTQQLEIASELGLNVIIHTRDSFRETMDLFKPFSAKVRSVFHCFISTPAEALEVTGLGSLVSYTGILTFKTAANVREAFMATPDGSYMFETDAPFLAPIPNRGKRCEPAHVRDTAEFAAQLRSLPFDEIARQSSQAAQTFFRGWDRH